jgi:uncharacterized protein YjbI with pentapeptide repeats
MEETVKQNLWDALIHGNLIRSASEDLKEERLDLRGLVLPQAAVLESYFVTPSTTVERLSPVVKVSRVMLNRIDFSDARLNGVQFVDCSVTDCVFQGASLRNSAFWNCLISRCDFRKANLRDATLGATRGERRNRFDHVDFSSADLRNTIYASADFQSCTFRHTKLTKVDFEGSSFTNCIFEGPLEEVAFARECFGERHLPPNEMRNVDFSQAQLFWVSFRGLNLDTVMFPKDDEHIILEDYPRQLDLLLKFLKKRADNPSKALAGALEVDRKWMGPKQRRGILNKKEILETGGGQDFVEMILNEISSHRFSQ